MTEVEGPPRILVVGCGGIGGNVAAGLAEHDPEVLAEVVAYSTNPEIARAVTEQGFRLTGVGGDRVVSGGRCVTSLSEAPGPYDFILLAVQPPQLLAALDEVEGLLASGGRFVPFQNGLCEWRLAEKVGADRVIGGLVGWGASMPEPGLYERTSEGGFILGRIDGGTDARLEQLALLLEIVAPVTITTNLAGARWSKLAINCAISTLGTIGGDRLGVLMRSRFARRLALEVMSEVVEVARAEGIVLEKISGTLDLEWLALTEAERVQQVGSASLVAKHTLLLAVGTRYRRMRSSMLSAIERGRTPAVDFLNGEVLRFGGRHGVPTPVNAAATRMVHRLAARELSPSLDALRALAEEVGVRL